MKCKHDISFLIGTTDGILCKRCGKLFQSFDELKADGAQGEAEPDQAPVEAQAEKPKRTRRKKEE